MYRQKRCNTVACTHHQTKCDTKTAQAVAEVRAAFLQTKLGLDRTAFETYDIACTDLSLHIEITSLIMTKLGEHVISESGFHGADVHRYMNAYTTPWR